MNTLPIFPPAIHHYIRTVFAKANRRVCEKIARVPNCSEPSLDMTLIEQLSQYSGPRVVAPGWAVRIDVHYLGGLRHYRTWEVADIGILVFAKQGNSVVAKKTALLQSKRLYPLLGGINEDSLEDYQIGFSGLLPSPASSQSLTLAHQFHFTEHSKYKALKVTDNQYRVIEAYELAQQLDVYYMMYNPWKLDSSYDFPIIDNKSLGRIGNGGCRIVPAKTLRQGLMAEREGYSPTFADVINSTHSLTNGAGGWRLEYFVSDLLMKCTQGNLFERYDEENIFAMFNRRSGPIAASFAITVEKFGD